MTMHPPIDQRLNTVSCCAAPSSWKRSSHKGSMSDIPHPPSKPFMQCSLKVHSCPLLIIRYVRLSNLKPSNPVAGSVSRVAI